MGVDSNSLPTCALSGVTECARQPKVGFLCAIKKGSQVAIWEPNGVPEALVIVHPDDEPRLVYFDGTEEVLRVTASGALGMPVVVVGCGFALEVGVDVTRWGTVGQ